MKKMHLLFGVFGNIPNVITLSLWYFRTRKRPRPIDIERIVLITTSIGRDELFMGNPRTGMPPLLGENKVFSKFCAEYKTFPKFTEEDIYMIEDEKGNIQDDIKTPEQFEMTANKIANLLRNLTKDPDTELHCIYAGGRRIMSVYLGLALTILGRKQDHLYYLRHPEGIMTPDYFYPRKGENADIALEEIPFARLGEKYANILGDTDSYSDLVGNIQTYVDQAKPAIMKIADQPFTIIGDAPNFKNVLSEVEKIAKYDEAKIILLNGEPGTGKDVIARYFHGKSNRNREPFYVVYCSEIANAAFEYYLFGAKNRPFLEGIHNQKGIFEQADKGTVFLDNVNDMPYDFQGKMLRFLDKGEIQEQGFTKSIKTDIKIVMTLSKKPRHLIDNNIMREDFYHRINTYEIHIPPLRERSDDIEKFVNLFIAEFSKQFRKNIRKVSKDLLKKLKLHSWKEGNIRELRSVIERTVLLADDNENTLTELPDSLLIDREQKAKEKKPSIPQEAIDSIIPFILPPGIEWKQLVVGFADDSCKFDINDVRKKHPTEIRTFKEMGFQNIKSKRNSIRPYEEVLGKLADSNGILHYKKTDATLIVNISETNERLRHFFKIEENLIECDRDMGYYCSIFKIYRRSDR